VSKWIETWGGGIEVPDFTDPKELSSSLQQEYNSTYESPKVEDSSLIQQPQRIGPEDDNSLSSRLGRYLRMKVDDVSKIPKLLDTAVNGPDQFSEDYAGGYNQTQLEAINKLVSNVGLTGSVATAGRMGAGSVGTFIGPRGAFNAGKTEACEQA